MGLHGRGSLFGDKRDNRKEYKSMELYGGQKEPFSNKTGVFDCGDELFGNLGIFDRVNAWRKTKRKQKLEKVLEEIIDKVNTIPRGFGSLPQNRNISLNGYFNYKRSDLQGEEHTAAAKVLGTGNDHETNVRLYAEAMQFIEDSFYDCRHLYKGEPELEARAKEVKTDLEIREVSYNFLRVEGYQEDVAKVAFTLDKKYGAITPDWRYKETAKSGIAKTLDQAAKELGLSSETTERLKVHLMDQELYFVPRDKVIEPQKNESQTRPFEERLLNFIKEHEPGNATIDSDRLAGILKEGERVRSEQREEQRESLKAYARRALAGEEKTTSTKDIRQTSTPQRGEGGRNLSVLV